MTKHERRFRRCKQRQEQVEHCRVLGYPYPMRRRSQLWAKARAERRELNAWWYSEAYPMLKPVLEA